MTRSGNWELKECTRNILLNNHLKKQLNYFAEHSSSYLNFTSQSPLYHDARNNPVWLKYHELHDDAWGNRKHETYVKETEWHSIFNISVQKIRILHNSDDRFEEANFYYAVGLKVFKIFSSLFWIFPHWFWDVDYSLELSVQIFFRNKC